LVGFGFDACILSDAADQPPLILTTQGTLPFFFGRGCSPTSSERTALAKFHLSDFGDLIWKTV
jgi:hypothetical protein